MSLEDVLEAVPRLRGDREIETLAGGLTNTNYKVTTSAGRYVVRISGKDSGLLAIDRENEVHNTIAAAETGVGAPVVAALPEHDALVLEFLEGEVMDAEKLRRGDRLESIAACVSAPASCASFPSRLRHVRYPAWLLRVCTVRGFRFPERYHEFEPRVRAMEKAMALTKEQTGALQQRLLAENLIAVDGTMRLIDYEYSGNNEPSFELGNVWSESNLSLGQLEELVSHYYGRPLRNKVARARLWGLMSKYGWTLWGSIQDGVSEIDFDFWGWAMEKYDRAVAEFEGPEFGQLLEDVRCED